MKKQMKLIGLSLVLAGVGVNSWSAVVSNYFEDGSFEAITVWDEPNAGTTPWFTTGEGADGSFITVTDQAHSGLQSVKFTFYYDEGAVVQNLNAQVDSSKSYEVSFWMLSNEPSTNVNHTNAPTFNVGLYTSPTPGGTYTYRSTLYTGALNSDTNIWEKFSVAWNGISMAGYAGEYIQLRFNKPNKNTTHKMYIDDVAFGEYAPDPAPASMLIGWTGSTGTNNDHHATGIDGSLFTGGSVGVNATAGSTDGTYGSTNGATLALTAYEVRVNTNGQDVVGFQIRNETGGAIQLDSISFDYSRWYNLGPTTATLTYAYGDLAGITNQTVLFELSVSGNSGKVGDYIDYDVSLTNLPDRVLSAGQKATFNLIVSDAGATASSGAFDNIAIFGGPAAATGYDAWAGDWGVDIGSGTNDYDSDGLDNLSEYALGGNPTVDDAALVLPTITVAEVGGTNWFYYVHNERTDDSALIYAVELKTDLVYDPSWETNAVEFVDESGSVDDFKSVTNRVSTEGKTKEYIRLRVEN